MERLRVKSAYNLRDMTGVKKSVKFSTIFIGIYFSAGVTLDL
jgi:hypothetical protein